jgi:hypothetical protein
VKLLFLLLIIITSVCSVGFAQCELETDSDRNNCENLERLKEQRKMYASILEAERLFVPNLKERLPDGENAWIVSVIRSGGWAGPSNQLIATVKSDGNYLCRKDDKFLNFQIQSEKFEPISQLFSKIVFSFYENSFDDENYNKSDEKPISVGYNRNSIATTTLIIVKRETAVGKKKKIVDKAFRFKMVDFPSETSVIRQIYDSTIAAASCEN